MKNIQRMGVVTYSFRSFTISNTLVEEIWKNVLGPRDSRVPQTASQQEQTRSNQQQLVITAGPPPDARPNHSFKLQYKVMISPITCVFSFRYTPNITSGIRIWQWYHNLRTPTASSAGLLRDVPQPSIEDGPSRPQIGLQLTILIGATPHTKRCLVRKGLNAANPRGKWPLSVNGMEIASPWRLSRNNARYSYTHTSCKSDS